MNSVWSLRYSINDHPRARTRMVQNNSTIQPLAGSGQNSRWWGLGSPLLFQLWKLDNDSNEYDPPGSIPSSIRLNSSPRHQSLRDPDLTENKVARLPLRETEEKANKQKTTHTYLNLNLGKTDCPCQTRTFCYQYQTLHWLQTSATNWALWGRWPPMPFVWGTNAVKIQFFFCSDDLPQALHQCSWLSAGIL